MFSHYLDILNNIYDNGYNIYNSNFIEIVGVPGVGKTTLIKNLKTLYPGITCRDEPVEKWQNSKLFQNKDLFDIQFQITIDLLFGDHLYNNKFLISNFVATYAHTRYKYEMNIITKEQYDFFVDNIYSKIELNSHKCIILKVDSPELIIERMNKRDKDYDRINRNNNYINSLNKHIYDIINEYKIKFLVIDSSKSELEVCANVIKSIDYFSNN